ncbi:hypothetical protein IFR05_016694 [Cadophora sp. M221]|nr:hypothetical protein IFR05_016694 [Cadophora sp. M221]
MSVPVATTPAPPTILQPTPNNGSMDAETRDLDAGNAQFAPIADDFTLALTTRLATDIMLDRQLKPKKTQFRYNDLPPRSSYISEPIEALKRTHRRSIFRQFQLLEKTFGPEVSIYQKPNMIITRFVEECKQIEAICETGITVSQNIIFAQLEKLYTKFGESLDMVYDGFLTTELKARYDLEMKNLGRRKPQTYPFHFFKGALYVHTDMSGERLEHYPITLIPIPPMTLCTRLLDEALRTRSGHTDRFEIFRIMTKEVKRQSIGNTPRVERMIEALQNKYLSSVFGKLCANIDKQAKIIIRRFGVDYFFAEDQKFSLFLRYWAQRYCNIAENESLTPENLAQDVGKALYAFLDFLKASHDSLLEEIVEAKLLATVGILSKVGMIVKPPIPKFTVRKANIALIDKEDSNSRERVVVCIDNNELSYATGEVEEDLQISLSDLTLPFDISLFGTIDEDEESDDSDSDDEMFPPLEDDILHPIWHTQAMGKLQKCAKSRTSKAPSHSAPESILFGSIILSIAFPSLSASLQRIKAIDSSSQGQNARSMAANPGSSKQARVTAVRRSSPISSPSRPLTPAVNKDNQNNGTKRQSSPKNVTKKQQYRSPKKWTKNLGDKMAKIALQSSPITHRKVPSMNEASQHLAPPGMALFPTVSTNGSQSNGIHPNEDAIDPQSRVNEWLNGPTVSAPATTPTAHIRGLAAVETTKQPTQAQSVYRTQVETYQASKDGALDIRQAYMLFGTDLRIYSEPPASESKVDKPLEDDWSSKPMPPPEGLKSWDEWSIEWSERRQKGYKLTETEFNDEIDLTYD